MMLQGPEEKQASVDGGGQANGRSRCPLRMGPDMPAAFLKGCYTRKAWPQTPSKGHVSQSPCDYSVGPKTSTSCQLSAQPPLRATELMFPVLFTHKLALCHILKSCSPHPAPRTYFHPPSLLYPNSSHSSFVLAVL